jgi:hypothetical protein
VKFDLQHVNVTCFRVRPGAKTSDSQRLASEV